MRKEIGGSKFSFGMSNTRRFKTDDIDEVLPGPAHYKLKSYTSTAPSYLFKFKKNVDEILQF